MFCSRLFSRATLCHRPRDHVAESFGKAFPSALFATSCGLDDPGSPYELCRLVLSSSWATAKRLTLSSNANFTVPRERLKLGFAYWCEATHFWTGLTLYCREFDNFKYCGLCYSSETLSLKKIVGPLARAPFLSPPFAKKAFLSQLWLWGLEVSPKGWI